MKYTIEKYPHCPPRHGFSIFSPDYRTRLRDIAPIGIVRELNKLLRRIEKLEKEFGNKNR